MGVRVLYDAEARRAVIYSSTTEWAFGPVFADDDDRDGRARAEAFLRWLWDYTPEPRDLNAGGRTFGYKGDPRALTDEGLERAYTTWLTQEAGPEESRGGGMSAHTPGPWRVEGRGGMAGREVRAGAELVVAVVNTTCNEQGNREANARVIAAAPDLLAALRRAHACATLREDGSCDGCFVSEAIDGATRAR